MHELSYLNTLHELDKKKRAEYEAMEKQLKNIESGNDDGEGGGKAKKKEKVGGSGLMED